MCIYIYVNVPVPGGGWTAAGPEYCWWHSSHCVDNLLIYDDYCYAHGTLND